MKIYKITKPETNQVYIGQTKLELKVRLQNHFKEQKRNSHREVYQWIDKTCIIELIEEFDNDKQDTIKEMTYIQQYITNGFTIINTNIGKYTLDPEYCIKIHSSKNNSNRHPDYYKWCNKISKSAKKEGLSSMEYRLKYSIPDYNGPKKLF